MEESSQSGTPNFVQTDDHDPFDITLELNTYDWREATNHRDAPSKRAARGEPPLEEDSQRPAVAHARGVAVPLKTEHVESALPVFAATDPPAVGAAYQPPLPSFGGRQGARASVYRPLGAPQEQQRRPSETPTAGRQDAAAMMLETLQSKLSCIQKTVKAMPRTGYAPQSRGVRTPQPDDVCHKAPSFDDLELLDEEFMALVDCPIPSSSTPPPNRKRKAGELCAMLSVSGFDR